MCDDLDVPLPTLVCLNDETAFRLQHIIVRAATLLHEGQRAVTEVALGDGSENVNYLFPRFSEQEVTSFATTAIAELEELRALWGAQQESHIS